MHSTSSAGRLPAPSAARLIAPIVAFLALLTVAVGFAAPAQAQLQLRIGGGNFQPLPIAIADFGGDPSLGGLVSGVVTNNLRRSGYFTPLDHARFPEILDAVQAELDLAVTGEKPVPDAMAAACSAVDTILEEQ